MADKLTKSVLLKCLAIAIVAGALWVTPTPVGLDPKSWHFFSLYIACIMGIVLSPFSAPVSMLVIFGFYSFLMGPSAVLSGYSGETLWLLFAAFLISQAFTVTGLGSRIAYLLIGRFGKTPLGLGYAMAMTDLIIAPATPSNTARTGGITWPIFSSVATALDSTPEQGTNNKIASYLTILILHISLCTASLFVTSMVVNSLLCDFSSSILDFPVSWFGWFKAQLVPGLLILFTLPLLIYKTNPPQIKEIPEYKSISKNGLEKLGPMKKNEQLLLILFILALIFWSTGTITGFGTTTVALGFLGTALFFGILDLDDILNAKGAWNTFIWYGGILGVAGQLVNTGFFKWMAIVIQNFYDFSTVNPWILLLLILFVSVVSRYFITNAATFVTTFIPVLFAIGNLGGVNKVYMFFLLAFLSSYAGMITHYGAALTPLLVASRNVDDTRSWWKCGHITLLYTILIYLIIGIPYWALVF